MPLCTWCSSSVSFPTPSVALAALPVAASFRRPAAAALVGAAR
jgi:hypothetical protein